METRSTVGISFIFMFISFTNLPAGPPQRHSSEFFPLLEGPRKEVVLLPV